MNGQTRRVACCHLLLQGNRWMPVGMNRKLGPNDRCSRGGAVITAFLSAVVEGDTIVGWIKNSAFIVREVQLDGHSGPLDLSAAARALGADYADMIATRAGVVGISVLIAERRIQEQNTGHLASELREAAFERESVQMLDKIQGHPVFGVILIDD